MFAINGKKSIKHRTIVISAKSLMLIGALYFRCAKTISFSLAKNLIDFNALKFMQSCTKSLIS